MEDEIKKILQFVLAEYDGSLYCKNSKNIGDGYRDCILNLEGCKICPKCELDLEFVKKDYGIKD